ncbi:hypothetical protein JXQ70_18045 [bacterium]|nr:hypothetical protein [bacterium]
MMQKIALISGFTPFANFRYNPSAELLPVLHGLIINQWRVETVRLMTSFETSFPILGAAIERLKPSALFCLGLKANLDQIQIEIRARNIMTINQRRVDGTSQVLKQPIVTEADNFLRTNWPLTATMQALDRSGFPYRVSFNAGSFVCNFLYFQALLNYADSCPCLFIHIPAFPSDAARTRIPVHGLTFPQLYQRVFTLLRLSLPILLSFGTESAGVIRTRN